MTDQPVVAEVQPPSSEVILEQRDGQISPFADGGTFTAAQRMAKLLASSDMMPSAYRNNIPNCLIAMELAKRTGASVMMVAQNLDIIHGRPSWRSQFLIACVNSCGRFTPLRFRFQGEEGKPSWGCRAVARDKETGEECVGALVTIKMAADEGWSTKNGSKWRNLGELMLTYRAAAFFARVYAPELALGMQTADEIEDVHGVSTSVLADLPDSLIPKGPAALATAIGIAPKEPETPVVEAVIEPEQQTLVADPPKKGK